METYDNTEQLVAPALYDVRTAIQGAIIERKARERSIAERWELRGYVEEAPYLYEQAVDDSRTASFRYTWKSRRAATGRNNATATEVDGLHELFVLLDDYTTRPNAYKDVKESLQTDKARDLMANLTFIGAAEYKAAAKGIGSAWKAFLDEDPRRQICVVTVAAQHSWYAGQKRKSDDYLKCSILDEFTDEELHTYSGRIVEDPKDLASDPSDVRVVLLDDWIVSGKQMRDNYIRLMRRSPAFRYYAAAGSVEVNLATAAVGLSNGLKVEAHDDVPGVTLPVRAYYRAHFAYTAGSTGNSYITGLHCAVNYGFGTICEPITKVVKGSDGNRVVPALSHIAPCYRDQPATIRISPDRIERVPAGVIKYQEATALAGSLAVERMTSAGESIRA